LTWKNGLALEALYWIAMSRSRLREVEGCSSLERRVLAKDGIHVAVGTSKGGDITVQWRRVDAHANERDGIQGPQR
jgi:hypothetical protein